MLTGLPPYFHKNARLIQKNIMHNKLSVPKDLSSNCRDLLKVLLNKDPSKRLGNKNGAIEILKHPWFGGIKLSQIEKRLIRSYDPYLIQSPNRIGEDVSKSMKQKMVEFNLRYQKQIEKCF
jgi:serine/threonine protein kinase